LLGCLEEERGGKAEQGTALFSSAPLSRAKNAEASESQAAGKYRKIPIDWEAGRIGDWRHGAIRLVRGGVGYRNNNTDR